MIGCKYLCLFCKYLFLLCEYLCLLTLVFKFQHRLGIFSPEAMENYKALEAWKYFQEGWVQTVVHMKISQDIMILKCDVRPSYRATSPNHKPWVALDVLGNVVTAHCNCKAG